MSVTEWILNNEAWDLLDGRRRDRRRPAAEPEAAWDQLQRPAHTAALEPQYRLLRSALDSGWRIEEPVYLRPRWSGGHSRAYHFILRHMIVTAPRLLTVPEGVDVERFVADAGLSVVTSR